MKKTFKEYLAPTGYTEGPMQMVAYMGSMYVLDRIFELSINLPVTNISLEPLKWMLDSVEPKEEGKKKKAIDVNVPIIVTPHNGQYIILDGLQRAMKALRSGAATIPARIVFHDILAIAKFGTNNQGDLNGYLT